mgnify:CR=1 FL=1
MSKDHVFNHLEKKYYDYFFNKRKTVSDLILDSFALEQKYQNQVKQIKDVGYVGLQANKPECNEEFTKIRKEILDYYDKNSDRTYKNPLMTAGVFEYIKSALVPFAISYFKCIPTIGYVKIIKSEVSNNSQDTQFFHRDPGSYNILKSIVYLNDVGPDGGPLVYVNKSNHDNLIGFSGRMRFNDKFVEHIYPEQAVELTGESGQVFFFDAKGIHKGKLPTKKARIAIIVNFTVHPEYGQKDNYSKIKFKMSEEYSGYDLLLLDSCMPIFGL